MSVICASNIVTFINDQKNHPFGLFSAAFWSNIIYVCSFSAPRSEKISSLFWLACARKSKNGLYSCNPSCENALGVLLKYCKTFSISPLYVFKKSLFWSYHFTIRCIDSKTDAPRVSYGCKYKASCSKSLLNSSCGGVASTVFFNVEMAENIKKKKNQKIANHMLMFWYRFGCLFLLNPNERMLFISSRKKLFSNNTHRCIF